MNKSRAPNVVAAARTTAREMRVAKGHRRSKAAATAMISPAVRVAPTIAMRWTASMLSGLPNVSVFSCKRQSEPAQRATGGDCQLQTPCCAATETNVTSVLRDAGYRRPQSAPRQYER